MEKPFKNAPQKFNSFFLVLCVFLFSPCMVSHICVFCLLVWKVVKQSESYVGQDHPHSVIQIKIETYVTVPFGIYHITRTILR